MNDKKLEENCQSEIILDAQENEEIALETIETMLTESSNRTCGDYNL